MAAGNYTLSAGAFAMQSSVDGVVKKIRKLGYEPEIKKLTRNVEMTRLLIGVYAPDVAAKKLREVKKITSGALVCPSYNPSMAASFSGCVFATCTACI